MIRNGICRCQSLGISCLLIKFQDSRHVPLASYTVFHEESESAVRIYQFLHPEEKFKKNQPTRVLISYRKISYHMSPPYVEHLTCRRAANFDSKDFALLDGQKSALNLYEIFTAPGIYSSAPGLTIRGQQGPFKGIYKAI